VSTYSLDFETTSACDIGFGAYRYAADPSTRILLFAIAKDDEAPVIWRIDEPDFPESCKALYLFRMAVKEGAPIRAFNVGFEAAICKYVLERQLGIKPPALDQWRCTQFLCRRSGAPPSLAKAAEFLKLGDQKNPIGKALIGVFSDQNKLVDLLPPKGDLKDKDWKKIERPSASPILEDEIPWDWSFSIAGGRMTVREGWDAFISYCRQDVVVEREVARKLAKMEPSPEVLAGFHFDLRMNDRGVPVDVPSLKKAQHLIVRYEEELSGRFREITGLNPSQTAAALKWLKGRGYAGDSLNAATVADVRKKHYDKLDAEGRKALDIRVALSFAAVKKVPAMMQWACPDGRIRGAFTFYGAQKTGRWTSQGPQFQNMKKPGKKIKKLVPYIYSLLAAGELDNELVAILFGNPYEVYASLSRYFVRIQGKQIYDVDFAQVEARILPALIGCERILDKFRNGEDIYMDVANALGVDRDMGKVISLLCQFQGGWRAVKVPLGDRITEADARKAVSVYRKENPEVVEAWGVFQDTWIRALRDPGRWHNATEKVQFAYSTKDPFPRMLMRLPAGRDIVYPYPKAQPITMVRFARTVRVEVKTDEKKIEIIEEAQKSEWLRLPGHLDPAVCMMHKDARGWQSVTGHFHTHELEFWGHIKDAHWGTVKTYGGDLLQSCLGLGTQVLTSTGFKAIETISELDQVWDGEDFVPCDGVIFKGRKSCVSEGGFSATPDHKIMVDTSWVERYKLSEDEIASQSEEFTRATLREFNGGRTDARRALHELESALRLRGGENPDQLGPIQSCEVPGQSVLFSEMPLQRTPGTQEPRVELPSYLRGSRLDDVALLPTEERQLPPLRGEGDQGLQEMARQGEVLQGHVADLSKRVGHRPGERPRGLHPEERPVGKHSAERTQQGGDALHGDTVGADDCEGGIEKVGDWLHDASVSQGARSSGLGDIPQAGPPQPVFDIVNCGPRNRFAILTNHGLLCVHNCTQGTGMDLLLHGCVEAERRGHEPFFVVHDQALGHHAEGRTLEDFIEALCTRPAWFPDFPLDADGSMADSYQKD